MKIKDFFTQLIDFDHKGMEYMRDTIPAGEWICSIGNPDAKDDFFFGHCARCESLIGSVEAWAGSTDHCCECHTEDDEEL